MDTASMILYGLDWRFILSCIMIIAWAIVAFLYLTALVYGRIHFYQPLKVDVEKSGLQGVSIVKPLNGMSDPNLLDNLTSYFNLNYPQYEILFCVQDDTQTELIALLRGLMAKFPNVEAKLFIGAQDVGVNPKVNNMMNAYENARYPLFMIADAGIKMKEDTLLDMISHMSEKVGLVHQVPLILDGALQFSRQVEKIYFGGAHARVYVAANALGVNCMTSMSCVFRKKILDDEGGLKSLGCYLGEDFFLSQLIINKGWRVVLCSQPADQNSGLSSVKTFQARMMRWMYLRFAQMPHLLILEPIQEHIFLGPLTGLAVLHLFNIPLYIFIPCHFVGWLIADYILLTMLERRRVPFSVCHFVKAWVFRELSVIYMYLTVIRMKHVSWGGQTYIVHYGGKAEKVNGVGKSYLQSLTNL